MKKVFRKFSELVRELRRRRRVAVGCMAFVAAIGIGALIVSPLPAPAETGSISFGITNNTFANAANITTMGQNDVSIDNVDYGTLVFAGGTIATNACNQLFVLSPVDADGLLVSNITYTLTFAQTVGTPGTPTTNYVRLGTNFDRSTFGAYDKLRLISATNQSQAGSMQSPSLKLLKKNSR